MNKIAAYQIALENLELEKRAEHLIDIYGTSEGYLPQSYLLAFDQLEKEAGLQAAGKAITGGIYRLGKAMGGTGASGARTGVGGKMMDFASRIGGRAGSGASRAGLAEARKVAPGITGRDWIKGRHTAQKIVGGVGLGAAGLGAAGLGYKALS